MTATQCSFASLGETIVMGDQESTLEEFLLDANREFLTHLDEFVFVKSAFLAVGEKHFQSEHVESLADQLHTNADSMAKELATIRWQRNWRPQVHFSRISFASFRQKPH
jgi:hypothetical protein